MEWFVASDGGSRASELLGAVLCGGLGLAALVWRWPQLHGTTLRAVAIWSGLALVAIAGVELGAALDPEQGTSETWKALRFIAAMSSFCPLMAALGAKRPQDRGWQFIVLSLWGILSLPAGEWLLRGTSQEIHTARLIFMLILILTGIVNGLATRGWAASLVFGVAQFALLGACLSWGPAWMAGARALLGLGGLSLCSFLQAIQRESAPAANGWDRVWLDFRDAFGLVWSLRVAERMQTSANMYGWHVRLSWRGFVTDDQRPAVALSPAVEESFRTLLRRFVSPAWIDRRLATAAAADEVLAASNPTAINT